MIQSIKCSNYRSFKEEVNFTFEPTTSKSKSHNLLYTSETGDKDHKSALLKYSLVYGANGSGKTNLFLILYAFVNELNNNNGQMKFFPLYDPYKFDSNNDYATFEITFRLNNNKYVYKLEYNKSVIEKEALYIGGEKKIIFKRKNHANENKSTVEYGKSNESKDNKEFGALQKNVLLLSGFLNFWAHETITPVAKYLANIIVVNGYNSTMQDIMLENVANWIDENPDNLKRLTEIIKLSDTGVHSISVNKNEISPYKRFEVYHSAIHSEQYKLDYGNQSYGTKLVFQLAGMMLKAIDEGTPIFIDEMDAGLHTYVTRWLLDIFINPKINKKGSQMLLSTHDINLLDETNIRRDQVWFAEKNKQGESELFSLSDFTEVREDTPFAKWYANSKFGGVPSIGAIENLFIE